MSSIPVSGDTDRTRSQGGAPVEADQRPSSRAPHRPAPRPPQPSGQHHHWGSSSSSSSRGGYSHHRYSDPWLPHSRDPSNLFRGERGPLASSGLGPSAQSHANWELYRPASASPAYLCHGPQSEHKTCNLEACPGGAVDLRAAQCSGFNSQEFMGRRYEWEPFLEAGGGYQRCELNCRPVGFRFYVRHAERVWDGTPCQGNSSALCITGRCLSPGCDGVLGSNLTLDSCGVCGGDGATCRRVAGTFQNSSVPIGYHQFLKIPPGATRITITERERSPNYLALRTGSGLSVINGRWAVDPPGQYEAGGTLFQYRRGGAGGEMLTAPGPTTTVLLVYIIFHKKNPGIDYEFYLPAERRRAEELEREQRERQGFSALTLVSPPGPLQTPLVAPPLREASPAPLSRGSARNVRIPPRTDLPPQSLPDFLWRRAGLTDCSASCGKGFQFPVFQCVSRKTQQEVEDRKCDPTAKPAPVEEACNVQPCPAFWEAGAWSGCSQSCGPGEQQRQVQCRQVYGAHSTMVHPQLCSSLLRPNSTQPCQLRVCSHWEIRSNWSSCSVMCGQGQRTRSVRCVSTHGATVSEGECSAGLRPRGNEACNMGPCVHSWLSSDWSNTCSVECGTGVQRRSVVCLASRADGPSEQSCGGARPAELRACSGGACQPSTRWYTGPWSECNVECGNGTQRRDIICVNKLGADFNVTPARDCAHLEKLPSVQECSAGPCRAKWYTTQWSACSRSCVGGVQAREVRCLTEDRALSQQCDPDLKPAEKQSCNTQPCTGETDENCRDTHHSCPLVVQARLCVYSYYRTVCCAACVRGAERSKRQRERERERDTETQRDRERETQRERDTERERHTETQRDRERETQRERDRERERQRERDTERERHRERERHTETQRHTERHRDTLRDTETH